MKEILKQYFKTDFTYVKVGLDNENDVKRKREIYWSAYQRALGAVDLAQRCGLDFETCEAMFNEYKKKVEEEAYDKMC